MQKSSILMFGLCMLATAACGSQDERPVGQVHQADFINGGFESGALAPWAPSTNLNPGGGPSTFPPMSTANLGLLTGGVDKTSILQGATPESQVPPGLTAADSLRYPKFGQYSAIVNQGGNNNNSNTITQTMTTTPSDVDAVDGKIHVRFALAPILENPNHAANQQPYFFIDIRNATTNTVLFSSFNFSNQPGVPFKNASANAGVQYTDWQLFDLAPGPTSIAIGDQLTATVIATGCSLGGHYGHILVDGFGAFIPGLTVVASAPQSANAGTNLTYTFVAKNGSSTDASNVVVTEVLPAGTTFVSVQGATCTNPGAGNTGTVTCTLGALNANASTTFQITVNINPATTGVVANGNYNIAGTGLSPLIGPLVNTNVTMNVMYTDLGITVTSPNAAADWGTPVTYTVVATNNGPLPVTGAMIGNSLPAQLTGVTWTCTGANNGVCGTASGSGALNTTANLPVGASVTYKVTGTVVAGSGMGVLSYLATIAPAAGITDPTSGNNSAVFATNLGPVAAVTVDKGTSTGTGTVSSAPTALLCGPTCTMQAANFQVGSTVTLTAVAAPGSSFTGWGGACANAGLAPQCTVTVSMAQKVSANFSLPTYPVTATVQEPNASTVTGTVACPTPIVQGRVATCTAMPATGYILDTVTVNGQPADPATIMGNGFTIANVQGPQTVVITFKKDLGNQCGGKGECHSGFCISGVCCDTGCDGACQACNLPTSPGICASACGNFACNAGANSCFDTCETSDQCISGGTCASGSCLAPAPGQYALSGGGLAGCSYSETKGAASTGAGLAFLGMFALLFGRRRLVRRAVNSLI